MMDQPTLSHVPAGTPTVSFGFPVAETLDETRAIRQATDNAFLESLRVDQMMERDREDRLARDEELHRQTEEKERRRQETIQARRQLWEQRTSPAEGINVKFQFPDGSRNTYVFRPTDCVQDLFTAAGMTENATINFELRVASIGLSLATHMQDNLQSLNLHRTTIQVAWKDDDNDEGDLSVSSEAGNVTPSLKDEIFCLESQTDPSLPHNIVNVTRDEVLDGGIRGLAKKKFNPSAKLDVKFSGEFAIDNGGPTREFFHLMLNAVHNCTMFDGKGNINLDYAHIDHYEPVGRFLAYMIVHRGPLPQIMSEVMYHSISGQTPQPTLADISDEDVREVIQKIKDCEEDSWSRIATETFEFRYSSGCGSFTGFKHQKRLVEALIRHHVLDKHKEAIERLKTGLQILGVLDAVKAHPDVWKEAFLPSMEKPPTANEVEDLFKINFSLEGSNNRQHENRVHAYWRDLLEELEDDGDLEDLLAFATGARRVPHLGFRENPEITFRHRASLSAENQHSAEFPYANTCALTLMLPVVSSYNTFKERMLAAIKQCTTFTEQ